MKKRLANFTPRGSGIGKPVVGFVIGTVFLGVGSLVAGVGLDLVPAEE